MSKELLISKLAQNLSDSELLDLAMAKLSDSDILELEKSAEPGPTGVQGQLHRIGLGLKDAVTGDSGLVQGAKNIGGSMTNAVEHMVRPRRATYNATGVPLVTTGAGQEGLLGRAGQALGHVGSTMAANPVPATVGAVGSAAALYMLAKKMGLIGQDEQAGSHGDMAMGGSCGEEKMAADLDAQLDKLAQDPAVVLAMHILAQNGLL